MPVRWRLTLFNAAVIGAILTLVGTSVFFVLREALLSGVEDAVRARAVAASRAVEAGDARDSEDLGRLAPDGGYVILRGADGEVLAQTDGSVPRGFEDDDLLWRRALRADEPVGGEVDTPREGEDYAYAVPVESPRGEATPYGEARVVEAGKPYGAAESTLEVLGAATGAGLLAALLLAAGGAYALARTALAPVDALAESARRITEGDLGRRLPVANARDEIGRLAATINGLLSRLEAAFAKREEALRDREEALARQQRFVSDAGHELRTPLTAIRGHARMLQRWGIEDPEAAGRGVDAILRETERMGRLAEDLLVLARGDEGIPLEREDQDLAPVVEEAANAAREAAGGRVAVGFDAPGGPVVAPFDRGRVRQIADILLDNALKYTPEGGEVRVAVRNEGGFALLEVSDTGIGIPEKELPLVFERFYRADPARGRRADAPVRAAGGTGLGLAIARQIAEAHGGDLGATSEPGQGSTFVLRLPSSP